MKNLMVVGCSYTALYYHPDPRWSYTWLLKEALNAENIINLAFGGNSANGCTRTIEWYLRNPIKGLPDFIYVQVPNGQREEYYISSEEFESLNELVYLNTNELLSIAENPMPNIRNNKAWQDYEKFRRPEDKNFKSNEDLIKDIPWNDFVCTAGTLWTNKEGVDPTWIEEWKKLENSNSFYELKGKILNVQPSWHQARYEDNPNLRKVINKFSNMWLTHKKPQGCAINTVRREIALMQSIAKKYNIPIMLNSSDNYNWTSLEDNAYLGFETFDDVPTQYDALINWDNVIKYESIANFSPTWAGYDDMYWDGHPGRQSHENYANAIIPKVLDAL